MDPRRHHTTLPWFVGSNDVHYKYRSSNLVYPAEGLEKDMERKTEEWYIRGMDKSKYPNIIWRNRNSVEPTPHTFLFLDTVE